MKLIFSPSVTASPCHLPPQMEAKSQQKIYRLPFRGAGTTLVVTEGFSWIFLWNLIKWKIFKKGVDKIIFCVIMTGIKAKASESNEALWRLFYLNCPLHAACGVRTTWNTCVCLRCSSLHSTYSEQFVQKVCTSLSSLGQLEIQMYVCAAKPWN